MIIIDNEKFDKLKTLVNQHEFSVESWGDRIELALSQLAREFKGDVYDELGLTISTEQVDFYKGSVEPNSDTRSITSHFKINKTSIALWESPEKTIEIPSNFRPPFAVHRMLPAPKVINYGGADTELPYDVIQYWPWGYDLERNVQIWRTINV